MLPPVLLFANTWTRYVPGMVGSCTTTAVSDQFRTVTVCTLPGVGELPAVAVDEVVMN